MSHVRGHGPPCNMKSSFVKYSHANEARDAQHAWRDSSRCRGMLAAQQTQVMGADGNYHHKSGDDAVSRRFSKLALRTRYHGGGLSPEHRMSGSGRISPHQRLRRVSPSPLGIVDPCYRTYTPAASYPAREFLPPLFSLRRGPRGDHG